MYIIKYSVGSYDDYRTIDIFVTDKKSKATKYVTKFNRILKTYSDYYRQFEDSKCSIPSLKDEYLNDYWDRWYMLNSINQCYWDEIKFK